MWNKQSFDIGIIFYFQKSLMMLSLHGTAWIIYFWGNRTLVFSLKSSFQSSIFIQVRRFGIYNFFSICHIFFFYLNSFCIISLILRTCFFVLSIDAFFLLWFWVIIFACKYFFLISSDKNSISRSNWPIKYFVNSYRFFFEHLIFKIEY
jgi:hypothetical protein